MPISNPDSELKLRTNSDGKRLCGVNDCPVLHYAKNLCRNHYQKFVQGRLEVDGSSTTPMGRPTGSKAPSKASEEFKPNDWLYVGGHEEFWNKHDGNSLRYGAATKLYGFDFIKDLVLDRKIQVVLKTFFDPNENSGMHPSKGWNLFDEEKMIRPEEYQQSEKLHPYLIKLFSNLGGLDTNYLLDWLAYGIQFPGAGSCALVLHGIPGAGKGTLGSLLKEIYGPFYHTVNAWTLENEFNGWLENRMMIMADEISVKTSKERDRIKQIMKIYTMPGQIEINRKGVDQYSAQNFSRWIVCSNEDHPVDVDINDRRYSVITQSAAIEPSLGETIYNMRKELAQNMCNHLSGRDLANFRPMVPLQNKAREDLKASLAKVYKMKIA